MANYQDPDRTFSVHNFKEVFGDLDEEEQLRLIKILGEASAVMRI